MNSGGKTMSKQSQKCSVLTASYPVFKSWLEQTDGLSYAHLAWSHVIKPGEVIAEGSHCLSVTLWPMFTSTTRP